MNKSTDSRRKKDQPQTQNPPIVQSQPPLSSWNLMIESAPIPPPTNDEDVVHT